MWQFDAILTHRKQLQEKHSLNWHVKVIQYTTSWQFSFPHFNCQHNAIHILTPRKKYKLWAKYTTTQHVVLMMKKIKIIWHFMFFVGLIKPSYRYYEWKTWPVKFTHEIGDMAVKSGSILVLCCLLLQFLHFQFGKAD